MKLNRAHYILQIPVVEIWLERFPDRPITELASEIALNTHCPLLIVYQYIGEIRGFTPDLIETMNRLKKFYGVESIVID